MHCVHSNVQTSALPTKRLSRLQSFSVNGHLLLVFLPHRYMAEMTCANVRRDPRQILPAARWALNYTTGRITKALLSVIPSVPVRLHSLWLKATKSRKQFKFSVHVLNDSVTGQSCYAVICYLWYKVCVHMFYWCGKDLFIFICFLRFLDEIETTQ